MGGADSKAKAMNGHKNNTNGHANQRKTSKSSNDAKINDVTNVNQTNVSNKKEFSED